MELTDQMKKIVTSDCLQRVCEKYQAEKEYLGERAPVAVFRRPDSTAVMWKPLFNRAEGEFLAEMVQVYRDGKYLCDHAMVL